MATPTAVNFELVEYIHQSLKEIDYTQWCTKFTVILGSYFIFIVMYILSAVLGSLSGTYKNLNPKEKIFWNMAVVRAGFGTFSASIGFWAVFTKTELDIDVVYGTTKTSYFALAVTIGFYLFECTTLVFSDLVLYQISFLLHLHHWIALMCYSIAMVVDSSHCFITKGLLFEISTPFSALSWILQKCVKERSIAWKANQFLLVHTFHLRNVIEIILWKISYDNWPYIRASMPTSIFLAIYIHLIAVTCVMTPYWTYKKTAKMINPVDWNFENNNPNIMKNGNPTKVE